MVVSMAGGPRAMMTRFVLERECLVSGPKVSYVSAVTRDGEVKLR